MTEQILARGRLSDHTGLAVFNKPVFESHGRLVETVRQHLGQRYAAVFSRPEVRPDGEVVWWTTQEGAVRRWTELGAEERARLDPARLEMGAGLERLASDLGRSGINTRLGNMAPILAAAPEIPGIEHLYVVGDQFALAFWGFRDGTGSVNAFGRIPEPVVPPPAAPVVPPAPVRGFPWLRLLLGALLLALLAALLWWWLAGRTPEPVPEPVPPPVVPQVPQAPPPVEPEPPPAPEPVPEPPPPPPPEPEPVPEPEPPPEPPRAAVPPAKPPEPPPSPAEARLPQCPQGVKPSDRRNLVVVFDVSLSMGFPADVDPAQLKSLVERIERGDIFAQFQLAQLQARSRVSRIDVARSAMTGLIDGLDPSVDIGLVNVGTCPAAETIGVFPPSQRGRLRSIVQNAELIPETPLADGLVKAGELIRRGGGTGMIVVISDGEDSCGQDPCATARRLAQTLPGVKVNLLDVFGSGERSCIVAPSGGRMFTPRSVNQVDDLLNSAAEGVEDASCRP
ncbi:hypothetical protein IGS68_25015 [Skermanella sp. TT6]|uniref:VWFA domain-containing protein n=1 Tax=Skermanella cutis TaxID=2775420 RepID=A0ABX7B4D2_9PROT|nr:hypothetical protein [Skermanella sp. TT6]QQP89214.1 hypothetical protein IGS68_25015 [Skermanella sp. TT6]